MAKINLGILGGFMGKVGTVVGYFWKGKAVMRSYTRSVRNPKSSTQQELRQRFAAANMLAATLRGALELGLGKYAQQRQETECNSFVHLNFPCFTLDGGGTMSISYSDLRLAKGPLPKVSFGRADFSTAQQVKVPFTGNLQKAGADGNDEVFLVVYSPDLGDSIVSTPAQRSSAQAVCEVPEDWNGLQVHVWGFAVGGDGTEHHLQASESTYIGTGEVC